MPAPGYCSAVEQRAQDPASWYLTRRLFLAGIAATFAIAFVSLVVQVEGLFGARGITPLAERMQALRAQLQGWERWQLPTLLWFGASDARIALLCWLGLALALCALAGLVPRLALAGCWALYLSLVCVGWPFLSFQWDVLLLEAGLLAVVWAPDGLQPFGRGERAPARVTRWLIYWLLFRLMVLSGAVKLASGDPSWRDGTALDFHYWTQPLPHRLGYFAHWMPEGFKRFSMLTVFVIELGAPCLLLVPRGRRALRQIVAAAVVFLMATISATGNYGFFNCLTCVLCIPLLDDRAWRRLLPRVGPVLAVSHVAPARWRRVALAIFAVLAVVPTTGLALGELGEFWSQRTEPPLIHEPEARPPAVLRGLVSLCEPVIGLVSPLASFNSYGLFRVMTKERPEILVEGSDDGIAWKPYRFRYKPLELERAPVFAGLHMPRLDWQLWFAGLEHDQPWRSEWTRAFLRRLLEGSPSVLGLLRENPFPDQPPRFVRAMVALYRFSTPEERDGSGAWWQRGEPQLFLPVEER